MSVLKTAKSQMTKTSKQLKLCGPATKLLDKPFDFPDLKNELIQYIVSERSKLVEANLTLTSRRQSMQTAMKQAWKRVSDNEEEGEHTLQSELDDYLEANGLLDLEIEASEWNIRLEYRLSELKEQEKGMQAASVMVHQQGADVDTSIRNIDDDKKTASLKLPQLHVPTFDGNIREFSSFWTTFSSMINTNDELSDIDKFLFLKQSLKGNASKVIATLPVIEENYEKAVKLIKSRFDRGACMKDLIISDISKIRPAEDNIRQCRRALDQLQEKFAALECEGVELDDNPMWRTTILSKFPFDINMQVIKAEQALPGAPTATILLEFISEVISLKETVELTTSSYSDKRDHNFKTDNRSVRKQFEPRTDRSQQREQQWSSERRNKSNHSTSQRGICVCGDTGHSPFKCTKFTSAEDRRKEAKRTGVCWSCFQKGHSSFKCSLFGKCKTCGDNHHHSLCLQREKEQGNQPQSQAKRNDTKHSSDNKSKFTSQNSRNQAYTTQDTAASTESVNTTQLAAPAAIPYESKKFQVVLMTATALAFNEGEKDYEPVTVFIDSGAQRSFITSELSTMLNLPVKTCRNFAVSGIGEVITKFMSDEVGVTLKSPTSGMKLKDVMIHTKPKLTAPVVTAVLSKRDKKFIKSRNICISHPTLRTTSVKPAILIGQDLFAKVVNTEKPAITLPSGLQLTSTIFGYAISGKGTIEDTSSDEEHCTEYSALEICTPVINEALEQYKQNIKHLYEIESLGIKSGGDENEEAILKFMKKYRDTIEIKDKTATAGFPFVESAENLKDNFNVAFRRLQHLMKELKKDPKKRRIYDQTLKEYEEQGIIEEAHRNETDGDLVFYLPHRHVWTPTKSTKLRIVFDASSHAKGELSLNQTIFEGYSLMSHIHEILMQFRCHKYVMIADIQKAFLQVRLKRDHRDVTRFLWTHNLDKDPDGDNVKIYRFARVPFGINASPAILNQVILKHLEDTPSETNKEIAKSLYVDNVLLSSDTAEGLLQKYVESNDTFADIAMNLRDYLSNSQEVDDQIPEIDRATKQVASVLGMLWNSKEDTFTMRSIEKEDKRTSKRSVLSQLNGLCYDPLGLLTPLITEAKIFLQDLHRQQLSWDSELSNEDKQRWMKIRNDMLGFEFTVPRSVSTIDNVKERFLSVFVDSSKRVYACAAYVTTKLHDGTSQTTLYCSKSKVGPSRKELTIPRLELLAIFIGITMAENIIHLCEYQFDHVNFFSDSTIALAWLKSERRLPPMVTQLAQKVQLAKRRLETHQPVYFHHVPTGENIADVATRGLTKEEAVSHTWWNGPAWLNEHSRCWPVKTVADKDEDAELAYAAIVQATLDNSQPKSPKAGTKTTPKQRVLTKSINDAKFHSGDDSVRKSLSNFDGFRYCVYSHGLYNPGKLCFKDRIFPIEKYSSFNKAKRVAAYVLRFCHNLRSKTRRYHDHRESEKLNTSYYDDELDRWIEAEPLDLPQEFHLPLQITAEEIKSGESYLILQEQKQVDLVSLLKSNKDVNLKFNRVGMLTKHGRVEKKDFSEVVNAPPYIPKKSVLSELIATDIHQSKSHCGANQLVSEIRQKYWIPQDRALCKKITRSCITCKRFNGLPFRYPLLGPLPEQRVRVAPPFAHTGVDLMGPIHVKEPHGEIKRWVVLFTCLVTRLMHLEIVTDLSAKSFLLTLKRFIARRGVPLTILSDNGTNFRLSHTILSQHKPNEQDQDEDVVSTYLADHQIEWHFIPPSSPWMGGTWERLVGIVKRSMVKAIGRQKLDLEMLQTVICECESITNSRPITRVGDHTTEILRPIDFIYKGIRYGTKQGNPNTDNADPDYEDEFLISSHKEVKRAFSTSEKITEKFWTLWKTEYIILLRDRSGKESLKYQSTPRIPQIGEIVIVNDDDHSPRGEWKLARILETVKSKDSEIRSAIVLLPSGRKVQRPISRLIPLEIREENTQDSRTSDKGVVTTDDIKAKTNDSISSIGKRMQPARAAKKDITYAENQVTSTQHSVMTSSLSLYHLIAVCLCVMAPMCECQVLSCQKGSVLVNTSYLHLPVSTPTEICVNHRNCLQTISQDKTVIHTIPLAESIHDHTVQWRTIVDGQQHTESIMCEGRVICELIECSFCSATLGNPQCLPKTSIAALMLVCYMILTAMIIVWKCVGSCVKSTARKIARRIGTVCVTASTKKDIRRRRRTVSDPEEGETIPLIPSSSSSPDRSRFITFIAICMLISPLLACQVTHVVDSSQLQCENITANRSLCKSINEKTITVGNHRREICLRTRHGEQLTGQIKIMFKHIQLVCEPVVKYYTRNIEIETISAKRCSRAGSCTSNFCSEVTSQTFLPEFNQTYKFPGNSRCSESCGGIYCGCLLPTSACLFSRTFVKPLDDTIYQMISCPTWKRYLVVNIERLFKNGTRTNADLILQPESLKRIMNLTVSVEWINTPNLPILSSSFLKSLGNATDVSMIVSERSQSALVCPSQKTAAAMTNCHVSETCTCTATETKANCHCTGETVKDHSNSLDHRLPVSTESANIISNNKTIMLYSHRSIAEISISNIEISNELVVHNDSCEVTIGEAIGCFNCLRGASFQVSCRSKRSRTTTITCGNTEFIAACEPTAAQQTINIHTVTARLNLQCLSDCMKANEFISLQGTLAYHTVWSNSETTNFKGNFVSMINLPDFIHVLSVATDWWKTSLAAIICLVIAIMATVILGPSMVQYCLLKIVRGQKTKNT